MKCSYGERGSLTATCVRANISFFRMTSYRFDQLDETLKCLNCSLKSIESNSFDISGNMIKHLILQNSQIEIMRPKSFIGLIFLEDLDLSFNDVRSIYPGTFYGIKKVKKVNLSHNKINILSENGFLELVNLEELDLSRNNIGTIAPDAFKGLGNLKILILSNNQIVDIGYVFSNMTSLQKLVVDNNKISVLHGTEFENATSLLELNLSVNVIQTPSVKIAPNNSLKVLNLNSNRVKEIKQEYFNTLHNLEVLDLGFNYIEQINSKYFRNLFALEILSMSSNILTALHTGTFTGIPHLETLNFSNNHISEIVINGVFPLNSLHTLDISNNSLKDFDYDGLIARLPRLSYLKLDNNLLPCDLEKEMEEYFAEDNFKFEFYEPKEGSVKCVDEPVKRRKPVIESLLQDESQNRNIGGVEITLIVIICLMILAIGYLYFLQYKTHQGLHIQPVNRTISSAHLVQSEDRIVDEFA